MTKNKTLLCPAADSTLAFLCFPGNVLFLSPPCLRMKRGEKEKACTLLLCSSNVWVYFILFTLNPFVANGTCQNDEPIIKRVCKIP